MVIEYENGFVLNRTSTDDGVIDSSDISSDFDEEERIINHVNSNLELITRDQDGNYVNVAQDLHDSFVKHRRFNADLFPGSKLEIIKWSGQEVHRHEGGDYPIRLEVNDDGFLLYYLDKCVSLTKEGNLWLQNSINYPSFFKFFSFPDRNIAEEYLRSANNEGAPRNRVGGSLPSKPGLAEPTEYIFSDVVTLMTDKTSKECIRPLFYNLPREQINDFHIMAEDYETSILEYDIEHLEYSKFRYKFIPKILENDDEKLVKFEVDYHSKIIKISTLKNDYEFNYSELENGEGIIRIPIDILENHNNMEYRQSRLTYCDRWNDVWEEVIRIMNNRRR
ncbi:uncharacterized protein TA12450 [Theileria annulata]|uniref:Uncharacterized protein n=1 Tax=Theileria annulata TaxID=5874 RepID=Q4UE09_THEAN|nr:uncharacterized protein TA12450 [Theileria annulata]CAI74680.1 hypothetical protein TA12450 [Theileria annulata]|eukprot:XP_952412.1 hypothetical protein TA12450 [Theileria annulata]